MKINNEIREYIVKESFLKNEDIKDEMLIFEVGLLDSMGLLFLIEFLNEKYDIEVNDEELNPKNFESINSIVSFTKQKLKVKKAC